ncbi:MAG TPA: SapC family protein, partial [Sphingomicrobium sp.]|nr:SapC family protein [Sphingomicrobium sp.]
CPILFTKNPETGEFLVGAMFGFRPGENLISGEPGADGGFRPLDVERQGFFIAGEEIAIDPESSRLSYAEGDPLFEEDGEPTALMRRIQRALALLVRGVEETDVFIRTLVELRIVEPVDISLCFDDGENLQFEGLYTVSLDSIAELDDSTALSLFRKGYLQMAYAIAGSLHQIRVLASRRNHRLVAGLQL